MAPAKAKPLKIGLILDTSLDTAEGVPQYVIAIGEWLRSQGHDVHYLVGQTEKRELPNIHSLARNFGVRFNGSRTTIPLPTSRHKLRELIKRGKFDVLHVQTPHHPLLAQRLILAAGPQTAVIGTFHIAPNGPLVSAGNKALGLWLKPSLKRIDTLLSVSETAAGFAKKTFGLDSDILPNVIDYNRFHGARPFTKFRDGKLNILFLGKLVQRKGCLQLIKAVAEARKDQGLPDFRVIVCGTGPLEPQIRKFIAAHGLEKIVELEGFVSEEDKPRYYASADISVFPSNGGESFGIVLLEAMASGSSAILAGDNPGYRSVLASRPELLFDTSDTVLLAGRLRQYLTNSSLRKEISGWGEDFSRQFDVNAVGKQLLAVYARALQKRRGT